jgi:hypothetical protein
MEMNEIENEDSEDGIRFLDFRFFFSAYRVSSYSCCCCCVWSLEKWYFSFIIEEKYFRGFYVIILFL